MRKAMLILAPALAGVLFAAGLLSFVLVRAVQDAGHAVGTGLAMFRVVTPAQAKKIDKASGTSLPFQSIDIAMEGSRIVRTDNRSQVWPTVVRSTKGDLGVMPDAEAAGDNADADEAASKRMLAQGK